MPELFVLNVQTLSPAVLDVPYEFVVLVGHDGDLVLLPGPAGGAVAERTGENEFVCKVMCLDYNQFVLRAFN